MRQQKSGISKVKRCAGNTRCMDKLLSRGNQSELFDNTHIQNKIEKAKNKSELWKS
jgi:hypothetical protein